uniref:NADH-ubiquinone oxidoreductase chain 4 n=1 Tax=Nipponacmea fuscoviridis TaxID=225302 RepID=A0A6B9Q9D2_9GAST|nr:NADH dehydrogenase subunit 4 [Nipponacmea fuscoviridis]QHE50294.1 NADH dehydrogenase subunit 4 [Nipponacmea fuscoviridis]QVH34247.1 NADH dehydrogenase subunit 4 [Nipponacmea fuscoviridis]
MLSLFSVLFTPLRGRREGHFMRCFWLALGTLIMSTLCYRPGITHTSVVAWGAYTNQMTPWLVCLCGFISLLAMILSTSGVNTWLSVQGVRMFGTLLTLTNLVITLCFLVSSLLWFYVLFEASLIPMFLIIAGWSPYRERIEATYYMVVYTVGASLPLLLVIAYLKSPLSKVLSPLIQSEVSVLPTEAICCSCLLAFLVKLPMYPFHLWLPKAHVEAPTAGSMLLAGVMLKLGGFGLVCSLTMFGHYFTNTHLWLVSSLALVGGAIAAGNCLLQPDLKAAIAYSSVAHMSIVIYGAASLNTWGLNACALTMISHGLTSSGLFCLAHWVFELTSTRQLSSLGGLHITARSLSNWGLALLSANIPTPPWLSMAGEVMVLPSIASHQSHSLLLLPLALMMFLGAAFSLSAYVEIFMGPPAQVADQGDLEKGSHLTLYAHLTPLLGLMFFVDKMVCLV